MAALGPGERLPMVEQLESLFPALRGSVYKVTSPPDDTYNCVAWAAEDTKRWWWPDLDPKRHWPVGIPRLESLEAFESAFSSLRYTVCNHDGVEIGLDKIALFADADGFPLHVARQLPGGRWTSKLGELQDIEHALHDLEGTEYGSVVRIMQRPRIDAG
jgi:hypothetical protein